MDTFVPIRKKDIIADMHTHTIYSKHALSTLKENLDYAILNGMNYIACTDHYYGSKMSDIDQKNEIARARSVNRVNPYHGVNVINSMEFNLSANQDYNALTAFTYLKYIPFGLHDWFCDVNSITLQELFELFVRANETCYCNAFVHIERELNAINNGKYGSKISDDICKFFKDIVDYAKSRDILLELNESSLKYTRYTGNYDRAKCWLQIARDNGNKICLGSDAHFCEEVGVFPNAIALLNEVQYPRELILNCNEDWVKQYMV